MSVQEMQACLARLYVDDSFLRLFEIDANIILGQYFLSDEERAVIEKLDSQEVRFFASSLKAKREKLFRKFYSTLFAIDEKVITHYYIRFYDINRISPDDDQADIYQRFGRFMENSLSGHPTLPSYASDLARFERLCLWAKAGATSSRENGHGQANPADSRTHVTLDDRPRISSRIAIGTFEYPVKEIGKQIQTGEIPDAVAKQRCTLVFRKADLQRKMRVFEITEDTWKLLDSCDGRKSVSDIIDDFNQRTGDDLSKSVVGALDRLLDLETIEA